jgi:outer membrane protein
LQKVVIRFLSLWLLVSLPPVASSAQDTQLQPLTLGAAVEAALGGAPSIRISRAQADAAGAGVSLARASYMPRADMLWQQNMATRNNVFGMIFPQSVIPAISGPQLDTTSMRGAAGSAGGLLFSWEPFDFGLRKAGVDAARAARNQADAGLEATRLDVATAAADAFLGLVASEQVVRAARANVERMEVFAKAVQALVDNQLRPGVDLSRAGAELAVAQNQLITAQQNAEISRAVLAEALGRAGTPVAIDAGPLLSQPPDPALSSLDVATHPLARALAAAVETSRARERVVDRSYFPRFNFQSAAFGRGTGALLNGTFDYGKGWYPNNANWGFGMTITFPALDVFGIRARRRIEASNTAAEQARYDQTVQTLKTQDARARAMMEAARRIAENTPIQLKAAQETELRARVRYENGLTNVVEVADAQRLLAQAEVDTAVARLGVWRALLAAARAGGDIQPFLERVAGAPSR